VDAKRIVLSALVARRAHEHDPCADVAELLAAVQRLGA
jgi:hypothetical protein